MQLFSLTVLLSVLSKIRLRGNHSAPCKLTIRYKNVWATQNTPAVRSLLTPRPYDFTETRSSCLRNEVVTSSGMRPIYIFYGSLPAAGRPTSTPIFPKLELFADF